MNFNEYQERCEETAVYKESSQGLQRLLYCALGLGSEAGEVLGAVKRILRDDNGEMSDSRKTMIALEVGDVMWYCAMIAHELDIPLDVIVWVNLEKLQNRMANNTIKGGGER